MCVCVCVCVCDGGCTGGCAVCGYIRLGVVVEKHNIPDCF